MRNTLVVVVMALVLSGCANSRQDRVLGGALIGGTGGTLGGAALGALGGHALAKDGRKNCR